METKNIIKPGDFVKIVNLDHWTDKSNLGNYFTINPGSTQLYELWTLGELRASGVCDKTNQYCINYRPESLKVLKTPEEVFKSMENGYYYAFEGSWWAIFQKHESTKYLTDGGALRIENTPLITCYKPNEVQNKKICIWEDRNRKFRKAKKSEISKIEALIKKHSLKEDEPEKVIIDGIEFVHNTPITCLIRGIFAEGRVSVTNGVTYICQNKKDGAGAINKLGYKYSWVIRSGLINNNVKLINYRGKSYLNKEYGASTKEHTTAVGIIYPLPVTEIKPDEYPLTKEESYLNVKYPLLEEEKIILRAKPKKKEVIRRKPDFNLLTY